MSETEQKWHDLNHEQWTKLFAFAHARETIARTLVEIIRSPDAAWKDRLFALQTLNESIMEDKLAKDPGYPELLRDVLLELTTGTSKKTRWFGRSRRRKAMHARLAAARWTLGTFSAFPPPGRTTQPDFTAEDRDIDPARCS